MGLMQRLSDADANAEGHDLIERGSLRVSWGWLWTEWTFGLGASVAPLGAWIALGPFSLGFAYEAHPDADREAGERSVCWRGECRRGCAYPDVACIERDGGAS